MTRRMTLSRWMVLAPVAASFAAVLAFNGGAVDCAGDADVICEAVRTTVELVSYGFPHGFAWLFLFLTPSYFVTLSLLALIDVGLALLVWRLAPPRLTAPQLAGFWVAWCGVSGVLIWCVPDLMSWGWALAHPG